MVGKLLDFWWDMRYILPDLRGKIDDF